MVEEEPATSVISVDPFVSERELIRGWIANDDTEYVDGGLYAIETPGSDGKGYSGGRGGAGNVKGPTKDGKQHSSDRRDSINEESLIPEPAEGEGYSTGRGGAANVHRQSVPEPEKPASTNGLTGGSRVARLGLAYDLESHFVTNFLEINWSINFSGRNLLCKEIKSDCVGVTCCRRAYVGSRDMFFNA